MVHPIRIWVSSQCFQATPKDPGCICSITLVINLRVRRIEYFRNYVAQESQNTREKAGDLENMSKLFNLQDVSKSNADCQEQEGVARSHVSLPKFRIASKSTLQAASAKLLARL